MKSAYQDKISKELLKLTVQVHKKAFSHERIMKCMPIPPSHVKVLFYLFHNGPNSVSHIGKELDISKPNMTPIIDKLVQNEVVVRYEDPKDRRRILVDITPKGHKILKSGKKKFVDDFSDKLSKLSVEELEELSIAIKNFYTIIDKL